jgi:hypothetical protein
MALREDFVRLVTIANRVLKRFARMVLMEQLLVWTHALNVPWVTIALMERVLSRYQLPVQTLSIAQLALILVSIVLLEHTLLQVLMVSRAQINANPVLQDNIV